MAERIVIAGVGMVPFMAAASSADGIAERAIRNALDDAGVDVELVDQAVASHLRGASRSGEAALAVAGLTGIAVSSVSNGAASGSAALFHARQALLSGEAQCALAVGYEGSADPGSFDEARRPCGKQLERIAQAIGIGEVTLARVVVKAHAHAARNPYARFRSTLSLEEALAAPWAGGRGHGFYVSAASCGAAAVVLCTPRFAAKHGLRSDVLLAAHALQGDGTGEEYGDVTDGAAATRRVAEKAYEGAGVDPADIDVVEIHDCCVGNELLSCCALGLCAEHEVERFIRTGANTYGGRVVVCPSGGMLCLGDAPGANGLAQICELTWQLRGEAGSRQVPGARLGLQHSGGHGGAAAVAILRRQLEAPPPF